MATAQASLGMDTKPRHDPVSCAFAVPERVKKTRAEKNKEYRFCMWVVIFELLKNQNSVNDERRVFLALGKGCFAAAR